MVDSWLPTMNAEGTISERILEQTCDRYGVLSKHLVFVGGIENAIYSYEKDNQTFFLRFGHSSHMTLDLVTAEIDWLVYLIDKEVPAVKPAKSENGSYIERIDTGKDSYNVVAFERAEGEHLDFRDPFSWTDSVIRDWGRVIGRMHSVTKDYKHKSTKRYEFQPELDLHLIRDNAKARENIADLFQRMHELPKSRESYGLVHSDIHAGNFFVKDNRISAILDFDRACYKWFISELAVFLYYPLYITEMRSNPNKQREYASRVFPIFWEGYAAENHLDPSWLEHLDLFMQVRDAILFMYLPPSVSKDVRMRFGRRILGEDSYTDFEFCIPDCQGSDSF
ncbi:MAG: phosphotransferase enzyme family protein [Promethearchaeota archaeon]